MNNYQRAAMHVITKHLNGRGARNGRPDAKVLRAEPFSSTECVLAEIAAALAGMSVGMIAAADRLDGRQWRLIQEVVTIARTGKLDNDPGRWNGFTLEELATLKHSLSTDTSVGGPIHDKLESEIETALRAWSAR